MKPNDQIYRHGKKGTIALKNFCDIEDKLYSAYENLYMTEFPLRMSNPCHNIFPQYTEAIGTGRLVLGHFIKSTYSNNRIMLLGEDGVPSKTFFQGMVISGEYVKLVKENHHNIKLLLENADEYNKRMSHVNFYKYNKMMKQLQVVLNPYNEAIRIPLSHFYKYYRDKKSDPFTVIPKDNDAKKIRYCRLIELVLLSRYLPNYNDKLQLDDRLGYSFLATIHCPDADCEGISNISENRFLRKIQFDSSFIRKYGQITDTRESAKNSLYFYEENIYVLATSDFTKLDEESVSVRLILSNHSSNKLFHVILLNVDEVVQLAGLPCFIYREDWENA